MSKKVIIIVGLVLALGLLGIVACTDTVKEDTNVAPATNEKVGTASTDKDSPIKKVDFKNFEYPIMNDAKDGKEEKLVLKEGMIEKTDKTPGAKIGKVQYADLTNDGKEEAIIDVNLEKSEKENVNMVYVYTLDNEKPKLLWSFDASGDSGLKAISADKGNLVVELFGDTKFVEGKWKTAEAKEDAKKQFTKTLLKWNGKEFVVEGSPEVREVEANAETKKPEDKNAVEKKPEDKKTESNKTEEK
jgi:hypothetical protein